MEIKPQIEPTLEIKDLGAVTELTRGSAVLVPFFENGVPPYDRRWPV